MHESEGAHVEKVGRGEAAELTAPSFMVTGWKRRGCDFCSDPRYHVREKLGRAEHPFAFVAGLGYW